MRQPPNTVVFAYWIMKRLTKRSYSSLLAKRFLRFPCTNRSAADKRMRPVPNLAVIELSPVLGTSASVTVVDVTSDTSIPPSSVVSVIVVDASMLALVESVAKVVVVDSAGVVVVVDSASVVVVVDSAGVVVVVVSTGVVVVVVSAGVVVVVVSDRKSVV